VRNSSFLQLTACQSRPVRDYFPSSKRLGAAKWFWFKGCPAPGSHSFLLSKTPETTIVAQNPLHGRGITVQRECGMTAKVIQGSFLGGQPKVAATVQPRNPPPLIQAKTAVSPPGPAFAGRSGPPTPAFSARPPGPPAPAFAGRSGEVQRHGGGGAFAVEAGQLGLASGGGRPLPEAVRGKMEAALGADFSAVRVHVGPQATRIGAIAFTIGSEIYFAPGRYQPDTMQGQQLLGHELAHVVQQRTGRVRNPLGSGLAVVQDHGLEAEADRLGRLAAAHRVVAQAKMANSLQKITPIGLPTLSGGPFLSPRLPPSNTLRPGRRVLQLQVLSTFTPTLTVTWDHPIVTQIDSGMGMFGHSELFIEYLVSLHVKKNMRIHLQTLNGTRIEITEIPNIDMNRVDAHKSYAIDNKKFTDILSAAKTIQKKMARGDIVFAEIVPDAYPDWKHASANNIVEMSCKSFTDTLLIESGLRQEYGGLLGTAWFDKPSSL
jgi:hypothetical protein